MSKNQNPAEKEISDAKKQVDECQKAIKEMKEEREQMEIEKELLQKKKLQLEEENESLMKELGVNVDWDEDLNAETTRIKNLIDEETLLCERQKEEVEEEISEICKLSAEGEELKKEIEQQIEVKEQELK